MNGKWQWMDGTELNVPSSEWTKNNNPGDCIALHGRKGYNVMSLNCEEDSYYVCERNQ